MHRVWIDAATIALFTGALLAPSVDQIVRTDVERDTRAENRNAAPRPFRPWTLRDVAKYPSRYEPYYADTFGLRDVLLRWNTIDKLFVFGVMPTSTLVAGDDGWILYGAEDTMPIFRGLIPASNAELDLLLDRIELRQRFCRTRGATYVYLLCPNKETIYPERVPARFNRVGPMRIDQFIEAARARGNEDVLDLRIELLAEKANDRPGDWLYAEHGTHWDGRGGWAAYRAVAKHLARSFPRIVPLGPDDIEWKQGPNAVDSWARHLYVEDILVQDGCWADKKPPGLFRLAESGLKDGIFEWRAQALDETLPRLLVFHDSFGPYLEMLLSNHFSETLFVGSLFDPSYVDRFKPDVVLDVRVERALRAPAYEPDAWARAMAAVVDAQPPAELGQLVTRIAPPFAANEFERVSQAVIEIGARVVSFRSTTSRDGISPAEFAFPPDRDALVVLDLETDGVGRMDLIHRAAGDPQWPRKNSAQFDVGPGRATIHQRLHIPPGRHRLMLRPCEIGRTWTLHGMQVYAVERY
jgi:hypothetical protein